MEIICGKIHQFAAFSDAFMSSEYKLFNVLEMFPLFKLHAYNTYFFLVGEIGKAGEGVKGVSRRRHPIIGSDET